MGNFEELREVMHKFPLEKVFLHIMQNELRSVWKGVIIHHKKRAAHP